MKKRMHWWTAYLLTIAAVLAAAHIGSKAATAMGETAPFGAEHCIVIDPGHGGEDGGAISCTGRPESAYNLEISLQLRDLLHLLGMETKMLRDTDRSIYVSGTTLAQKKLSDLKERLRIVSQTPGAIFVSIHQNHFPDPKYAGAQIFYGKIPGSETLAKRLQENFAATINPGSRRQCKKSQGVYLMERLPCPGVLVECGFLSNPEEEGKLRAGEYQKSICCIIASTIGCFLENS